MSTSQRSRKAQTALEFLTMTIFLTVVFAGVYSTLGERQTTAIEREVDLQAAATAEQIGYELDLALAQGDGYERTIDLRDTIGGAEYTVTVRNGTVALEWAESTAFATTGVNDLDGTIGPGRNTIANEGGQVVVG